MPTKIAFNISEPLVPDENIVEKKVDRCEQHAISTSCKERVCRKSGCHTAATFFYERANIRNSQLRVTDYTNFLDKRIAVVVGTDDLDHPVEMDKPIVDWLNQNGARAEFVALGDRGINGNGHMMMIEANSDQIAAVLIEWLQKA